MSDLPAPDPDVTPETEAFWEAAAEGRLLIRECADCGTAYFYPRTPCPECFSMDTEWVEASGEGTVYTYTITRQHHGAFGEHTPYVYAYVELDEGPRVMTDVVGTDPDDVSVGQAVEVVFDGTGGGYALPRFTPK